jgi:Fe-S-cluster containining protein
MAPPAIDPPTRTKPRRENLPPGQSLCEYCIAKCCRYFALPLDTPKRRADFDTLRWFLLHGKTSIFVEKGTWYLQVHTECRELLSDNRCGIYDTRPQICRSHSTKNCEYEDDWVYDAFFEAPEQLEEYVEARFGSRGKNIRSPRPGLPIFPTR